MSKTVYRTDKNFPNTFKQNGAFEMSATTASGDVSLSQGSQTQAIGEGSHAEGSLTIASGSFSHSEGSNTQAIGEVSHAEGNATKTGTQNAYYAQSVVSGVVTLSGSYGNATSQFQSGRKLYLYDTPFDNVYGKTFFVISASSFNGTETEVQLEDTGVNTTTAYVGWINNSDDINSWTGDQTIPGIGAHVEGNSSYAIGNYSHAEGSGNAAGDFSHAEGVDALALGIASHAEGQDTQAIGNYSHAEGLVTIASGSNSHAEGVSTQAIGVGSHAEGSSTQAIGDRSHVQGEDTISLGYASHAEGSYAQAIGDYSHAEGEITYATSRASHTEGQGTITGYRTKEPINAYLESTAVPGAASQVTFNISGDYTSYYTMGGTYYVLRDELLFYFTDSIFSSSYDGNVTTVYFNNQEPNADIPILAIINPLFGANSHAEGAATVAIGNYSHAEGIQTRAVGDASHAEGSNTQAIENYSHAEGANTVAVGVGSHAEGESTQAIGDYSHAEGNQTKTGTQKAYSASITESTITLDSSYGDRTYEFSDGDNVVIYDYNANELYSGAELIIRSSSYISGQTIIELNNINNYGFNNTQIYTFDVQVLLGNGVNGDKTIPGIYSHAEGRQSQAIGTLSHAEGENSYATGRGSHAEGSNTVAVGRHSHAEGDFTFSTGESSHAEGFITQTIGASSHAEGRGTQAIGNNSHAEGNTTKTGTLNAYSGSIASGIVTISAEYGDVSIRFTQNGLLYTQNTINGNINTYSISQSYYNNPNTIVELYNTSVNIASVHLGDIYFDINEWFGNKSFYSENQHTEGEFTRAIGEASHAEGNRTQTWGKYSHAEGYESKAIGFSSHAEGIVSKAIGYYSHAEGSETQAIGGASHAEGESTQAIGTASHAEGLGTIASGNYQHVSGKYNVTGLTEAAFIVGNGIDGNNRSNLIHAAGDTVEIGGSINLTGNIVFLSGVTGTTISNHGLNLNVAQDENYTIKTSYFAMSSPPGVVETDFIFQADGVLKVPGTITSDIDLDLVNSGTGDIRLGYQPTPVDIYIGASGDGKRLDLNSDRIRILANPPGSSIGSDGDFIGSVAFDSTYIYYCTANYDGVTNIWKRLQFSGDTW